MTAIEWTDRTWNPTTGCSKVSPGCANCYAETLSLRFGWSKKPWTPENAVENIVLHPERLDKPLTWRKPSMVFVNSMSDLFHELIPDAFIWQVFDVMAQARRHTFQVLTKRPERMRHMLSDRECYEAPRPLPNVWLGTSIENARFTWRADVLRETPAAVRFISAEPLLGSLMEEGLRHFREPEDEHGTRQRAPLDLTGIDWLIVGGESGHGHRPMKAEWARELRNECERKGTAFFFKQWGGDTPKSGGRLLDGREWSAYPELVTA